MQQPKAMDDGNAGTGQPSTVMQGTPGTNPAIPNPTLVEQTVVAAVGGIMAEPPAGSVDDGDDDEDEGPNDGKHPKKQRKLKPTKGGTAASLPMPDRVLNDTSIYGPNATGEPKPPTTPGEGEIRPERGSAAAYAKDTEVGKLGPIQEVPNMVMPAGAANGTAVKPVAPASTSASPIGGAAPTAVTRTTVISSPTATTPATVTSTMSAVPANAGVATVPPLEPLNEPKTPPPPPVEVLKELFEELKIGSLEAIGSVKQIVHAVKNKQTINLTLDQVVQALFFLFLGFQLLLIKFFRPNFWGLTCFIIVGVAIGLGLSYLFHHNRKRKVETRDLLATNLGTKGLQRLLGTLPTWLSYTEKEQIEWLNDVMLEVWPYVDKAACKMIRDQVEPIFASTLRSMKVAGAQPIKRIYFQHLTFGDAPFRVEAISVAGKQQERLDIECDVRWAGEANIVLAVELALPGEFAKVCPRVTDISFVGSLRITATPLVNQIPCVGAVVATFQKRPRYKYNLNFGNALGGSTIANIVKPVINSVIIDQIITGFIWPQRIVIPLINTEAMQIEVLKLSYRAQGLVKVLVHQADALPKADLVGKSDPFTELSTDGKYIVHTRHQNNTLEPRWEETFHLLVQEPTNQDLLVTVYDKDVFSIKEALTLNLDEAVGSKEFLGRAAVKLASITQEEGRPVTRWYPLGANDWSAAEGPGKGRGRIQLTCTYRSLESFTRNEMNSAHMGTVVCSIFEARNMPRAGNRSKRSKQASDDQAQGRKNTKKLDPMSVYVRIKVSGQTHATPSVNSTDNHHKFPNRNVFEFHNIPFKATISIKMFEDSLFADDELHSLDLDIATLADAQDRNPLSGKNEAGLMFRQFKLGSGSHGVQEDDPTQPALYASVRFVPYF